MARASRDRRIAVATCVLLATSACTIEGTTTHGPDTTLEKITYMLDPAEELLVVGDWGSGTDSQKEVAEAMEAHAGTRDVAAIVTTGDNFYSDDADLLMEPFDWAVDHGIPFLVSWGNHDIDSDRRIDVVLDTFENTTRWSRHKWGSVDIVILDSTQFRSVEQIDFLTEALVGSEAPTILVFHHPPYSCGFHGDTEGILEAWGFDDDVFLVLSGHEHNYQRFDTDDVTYVVSGGGGQSLTELAACPTGHPDRITGEAVHHFVSLQQDNDLTVTVIDVDGDVVDEFSLPLS